MALKIAINGFGRIGRTFLRTIMLDAAALKKINIVAINIGPSDPHGIAHLFKYDSIMRTFPGSVHCDGSTLTINDHVIKLYAEREPEKLPWKNLDIDWVVDASGCFTTKESATRHIKAGSKKVLITAPATDEDISIIPGVNDKAYNPEKHTIVSLGSCTTNCFAPMIKVIRESFGITQGLMSTTHAYTNDQVLLDVEHKDPRRARAAAINIIPTKTGADKMITKIYPDLEGKLKAISIRVPVPVVSLIDFTFTAEKPISKELINQAFETAAKTDLKNIIEYVTEPLVSSDFIGNTHSCILDSMMTQSVGNLGKVFAWYDNEFGYSTRLKDFLLGNS